MAARETDARIEAMAFDLNGVSLLCHGKICDADSPLFQDHFLNLGATVTFDADGMLARHEFMDPDVLDLPGKRYPTSQIRLFRRYPL